MKYECWPKQLLEQRLLLRFLTFDRWGECFGVDFSRIVGLCLVCEQLWKIWLQVPKHLAGGSKYSSGSQFFHLPTITILQYSFWILLSYNASGALRINLNSALRYIPKWNNAGTWICNYRAKKMMKQEFPSPMIQDHRVHGNSFTKTEFKPNHHLYRCFVFLSNFTIYKIGEGQFSEPLFSLKPF